MILVISLFWSGLNQWCWNDAIRSCDYVLHEASSCPAQTLKDENELIIPAQWQKKRPGILLKVEYPSKAICDMCRVRYTLSGYNIVKSKNLWYYKCNKIGCKCNRSADKLHKKFAEVLNYCTLDPHEIADLRPLKLRIGGKDMQGRTTCIIEQMRDLTRS